MSISTLKQTLSDYRQKKMALPAFNLDSFLTYQAVEKAVLQTKLPCIVQLSSDQDKFLEAERLFILVKKAQIDSLPIYLNMDHGQDISRLKKLARLGFDMLHFDSSNLDYSVSITQTADFIRQTKQFAPQILIEAEFDHIQKVSFTSPDRAKQFIDKTRADLLAVSVGNLHGAGNQPENLDLNLLAQIHSAIPDTFLVMHGGSGIDPGQLDVAVKSGIVKININTDLRHILKRSLLKSLTSTDSFKAYQFLSPVVEDLSQTMIQKLHQFTHLKN